MDPNYSNEWPADFCGILAELKWAKEYDSFLGVSFLRENHAS